ncbi:MAG: hypothetical protein MJB14_20520 [Spirochaetes bacterium]|nr:hypothetical protein [Spirochaetota bacterium]
MTDDNRFGGLEKISTNKRFSLFQIPLGLYKLYFFTIKGTQFKFFKHIKFIESQKWPDSDLVYQKAEKYVSHFNTFPEEKRYEYCNIEKEFLNYKINQLELIEQRNQSKTNLYITIALASIPLLLIWIPKLIFNSLFTIFLFVFFCIYALNFYIFMLETVKVRAVCRSSFADVKNAFKKLEEWMKSLYFDWRIKDGEVRYDVGIIKNAEISLIWSLLLSGLVVVVNLYFTQADITSSERYYKKPYEITIKKNDVRLSKEQLKRLNQLEHFCLNEELKNILVLRDFEPNESNLYDKIIPIIDLYCPKEKIIIADVPGQLKESMIIIKPKLK